MVMYLVEECAVLGYTNEKRDDVPYIDDYQKHALKFDRSTTVSFKEMMAVMIKNSSKIKPL